MKTLKIELTTKYGSAIVLECEDRNGDFANTLRSEGVEHIRIVEEERVERRSTICSKNLL